MLRSIFDASFLRAEFDGAGINSLFIPVIWKHVIKNPNCEWHEIPSLPSVAYSLLESKFKPCTSVVHSVVESTDEVTTKLLIKLQNGAFIEAVIMRYDTRLGKYGGQPRPGGLRSTLCISSQVGCKMGCRFCATGSMGFKNNLSSGEIVEQLVHAMRFSQIRNIVFMVWEVTAAPGSLVALCAVGVVDGNGLYAHERMSALLTHVTDDDSFITSFAEGMGEPLNNYTSLVESVRVMTAFPFQLSPRRITISTVGIVHAIKKLHYDLPTLNLAVSLHAPIQEVRCQIMPAARAFPLDKLMSSLQEYQQNSQQKILIEYIMLDAVNDEEQHAHLLGKLLDTFDVVVNLIPFNPIGSLSQFRTSNEQKVLDFQKILRGTYNIRTTIRRQMGQDISGACGQLVVNLSDKKLSTDLITDIEDLRL